VRLLTIYAVIAALAGAQFFPFPGPGRAGTGGGGGSPAAFSDDFNRADSASLGANWTEAAGDQAIFSNGLRQVTASYGKIYTIYSGTPTNTVKQYLRVQFVDDGGEYPGVILRYQNSSSVFYSLSHDSNDLWEWYSCPNTTGSCTLIGTVDTGTFSDGQHFGLTIDGTGTSTVIRIWKSPTANTPVSATEWDSGDTTPDGSLAQDPASAADVGTYVGLTSAAGNANTVRMDNFFGGDAP
jgi:hypothetical protein